MQDEYRQIVTNDGVYLLSGIKGDFTDTTIVENASPSGSLSGTWLFLADPAADTHRLTDYGSQDRPQCLLRAGPLYRGTYEPSNIDPAQTDQATAFLQYADRLLMLLSERATGVEAIDSELLDALVDLKEATDEAVESGFEVPSAVALANARRLLTAMYAIAPRRFEVYPTPDGQVAIDAPTGRGKSVVILCDSDGGIMCLVNSGATHWTTSFSNADEVSDGLLRDALNEVRP